ncbi:rhomboid family intramembrane serine protease [Halieaceae bacterium IMCC14734]|uniref:Rhomboid family intramembrane serine protease n=1 Tax=Candidatus Litorirhabdus singularis TaxID=2518993 RepID=A0ABT3TFS8_9GAMM|nr:rhomboid family intramembrane serine protease [Candidatus Litorirhabdus singularis]MCX2980675.1 rhomboid family intramembrane serine protease [Candidatus Litorirhabdus singularis]
MPTNSSLRNSLIIAASFAALLWTLKLFESALGLELYDLGVYPRALSGLIGIASAPLIHGSWQHLIGNTLPLLLLGTMLLYGYPKSRFWALAGIWLLSGAGVWLFARSSYHFGASGLTHGIFFYLFVSGILRRDRRSAALLMIAFYMYGGMLLTILPRDPGVSFESHFFGAMAGAMLAYAFRNWDPKPVRKQYSWQRNTESDENIDEDPVIGDQWRAPPPD